MSPHILILKKKMPNQKKKKKKKVLIMTRECESLTFKIPYPLSLPFTLPIHRRPNTSSYHPAALAQVVNLDL